MPSMFLWDLRRSRESLELIDKLAELLVTGSSHPTFERDDRRTTIVQGRW